MAPTPTEDEIFREALKCLSRHFYRPELLKEAGLSGTKMARHTGNSISDALARLGSSHTIRFTADQIAYYEALAIYASAVSPRKKLRELFPPNGIVTYDGIGVRTLSLNGRVFVTAAYHSGPAERAGIVQGDEIISIDDSIYSEINSFAGKAGCPVLVLMRSQPDGPERSITVIPERIEPNDMFEKALSNSVRSFKENERTIGYIRVWSYAGERYHHLVQTELSTGKLAEAHALILDLRGGWGGASPDFVNLYCGSAPNMVYVDRSGARRFASYRWGRPVIVLIDGNTRSGKEVLAFGLQRAGATLVGQPTAGAVLGAKTFLLSDGSLLAVATHDVLVDGERLEGRGLQPDIFVPFSLPLSEGRDPTLRAAIDAAMRT
ncbi:MAG: carboxyl-terminal protease [Hyphomicrobiales bacterium]|nr:carboxyl-terminal protease [Hyphomicrobiales bacterium]MBV8827172.1 carboxyl-terminal protease [Hyphomicrobiales bacterium]